MRQKLCMLVVIVALALAANPASAVTYEDSLEQCNYPKTFDLMVMRPVSFLTILAGFSIFAPLAPLAIATVPREIGTVWDNLVAAPARFTFDRKLGECTSVDFSY